MITRNYKFANKPFKPLQKKVRLMGNVSPLLDHLFHSREDLMKPVIRFSVFIVVIALAMTVSEQSSWAQEAPEGDTVSINGMQMYYEIYGQGDTVFLFRSLSAYGYWD